MAPPVEFSLVRVTVFAIGAAQGVFWLYTLLLPRSGLTAVDLVILWLTAPALFFGAQRDHFALGAGLAASSLIILGGLLN